MEQYDYEQVDDAVKESIIKLSAATKEANKDIIACYIGLESNGKLFNDFEVPSDYDARKRPWYTEAVKTPDKVKIIPPYKDITTNEWVLSLSKAIIDEEGVLRGVAAVDFTLEFANELMLKKGYYETQTNYMISGDGTVFIHPNSAYSNKPVNEIVPGLIDLFTSESGFIEYNLNGENRIAHYTQLEFSDWIIVSAIDSSELIRLVIRKSAFVVLALFGLAIVLGLSQMKIFDRSFVKPIIALKDRITEITTGEKMKQPDHQFSNKELAEIVGKIEGMAESSLREKADQLALILRSTSDGLLVVNLQGKVIHANNRFMEMWSLTDVSDLSKFNNPLLLEQLMIFENCEHKSQSYITLSNGNVIEQSFSPVIDNNKLTGRLWSYKDVTERVKAEEALKLMASSDALTGVWNRRYFMTQGQREFELTKRTGLPLSLIFLDVDRFKVINDTFGHGIGDEALKYLAQSISNLIRSTDLFARLGGEEFCVLALNTSLEDACILAEKIRYYFENNTLIFDEYSIPFTLSLGVASSELDDLTFNDLIECADKSCYEAKSLGRNRVVANCSRRIDS